MGEPVADGAFRELAGLLRTLVEECHHGKEEGYLFPEMIAKGAVAEGPAAAILATHHEGRDYLASLSGPRAPQERAAAALLYVRVMRAHLDQEQSVLFPVADASFTAEEQLELARRYEEVELMTFGPGLRQRLTATLARLEAAIPPPAEELP